MRKHKNHSKLVIPILLLFLSSSGLLFCQQLVEGNININSDYKIFREEPENNLFSHLQTSTYDVYNLLSSTIDLFYTKIDQLCADSLFVIDTIYFHEKSHFRDFNDYRRSFIYDKFNRIKTVIAEAYKDSNWVTHQITDVSYNSLNKVEQINFIRYQKQFDDSLIIKNEFDNNGLITKEVGETLDSLKKSWRREWLRSYDYKDRKLVGYKFENIKYTKFTQPNLIKYKYNSNKLLIERVEYLPETNFIDSVKYLWKFDEENNLMECFCYMFENSDTSYRYVNNYYYNNFGKLFEEIKIAKYREDRFTRNDEWMYYYNSKGSIDSTKYVNKIVKGEVDSLEGSGIDSYEYDP